MFCSTFSYFCLSSPSSFLYSFFCLTALPFFLALSLSCLYPACCRHNLSITLLNLTLLGGQCGQKASVGAETSYVKYPVCPEICTWRGHWVIEIHWMLPPGEHEYVQQISLSFVLWDFIYENFSY